MTRNHSSPPETGRRQINKSRKRIFANEINSGAGLARVLECSLRRIPLKLDDSLIRFWRPVRLASQHQVFGMTTHFDAYLSSLAVVFFVGRIVAHDITS